MLTEFRGCIGSVPTNGSAENWINFIPGQTDVIIFDEWDNSMPA